jgi:Flp pilus assembly protein TadG
MSFQHSFAKSRKGKRSGAAVVELALTLPLIMLLTIGTLEVGRLVEVQQMLSNGAREGARQASLGTLTSDQVALVVCQYLAEAGLPDYTNTRSTVVTVEVAPAPTYSPWTTTLDATSANKLDGLRVTVSIPANDIKWSLLSLITTPSTQISGQAVWLSERNQSYPTYTDPPIE